MIRLRDASMLALTKLRTRKVRLTITIIISGLLFGGLAGASMTARGIMGSIDSFGKEGLGERFITQAYPQMDYDFMSNDSVIDRALEIHKETVERKKVEAKRLGITYDPASDPLPAQEYDEPGSGKRRFLNAEHPAGKQAAQEHKAAHPAADKTALDRIAAPYQSTDIYESKQLPYSQGGSTLQVLKDGKESFGPDSMNHTGGPPTGTDSFVMSWMMMSDKLLEPFILAGQNLQTGKDGSIPIIVPNSAAEQLLKLNSLPASATSTERLERIKEIRTKAPSIRFDICYRNATSAGLVNRAVTTNQEIERNKDKKDYRKPPLIYGTPTKPCGEVPVIHDERSKAEKTQDDKQRQFDELFGAEPASQQTITFRIVGIVPDPDYGGGPAFGVGQIINSLVVSSLGGGWYMPAEQLKTNPLVEKLFNQPTIFGGGGGYYVEFDTAAQARSFIEKENCDLDYSKIGPGSNPQALCQEQGKPFSINTYGSNSLALESAKRSFGKFFRIAALIVSLIAAIIMMGTVGRMIADSRRETAVFRAIGAKKLDIAQIYVVYTICLSLLIALFAVLAGLALALYANHRWAADATAQALVAYNAQDLGKTFNLYAFYLPDLLLLVGLAVAAGLLSSVIPLIRNSRRNPIRDMRDDT